MWRISFMVQDRDLSNVMTILDRPPENNKFKVYNLDPPRRVLAEDLLPPEKQGKWIGKAIPGKKKNISSLKLRKGWKFSPSELGKRLPAIGWAPNSATYANNALIKAGRVKKLGNGKYEVI